MAERYQEGRITDYYTFEKKIGDGGMSEVYKGRYKKDGREVAIKIFDLNLAKPDPQENEKNKQLFRKEAITTTHLRHPNIVPFYFYGIEQTPNRYVSTRMEERPYIIIAYANEGSVRSFLQRHKGVTPEQTVDFLVQAASGLQYAHEQRVLHRDIKPGNFLLNKKHPAQDHLDLWVADFGIAVTAHTLKTKAHMTRQEPYGTAAYMAPEQFEGKAQIPSDIYSLGVTAYELLTGQRPFEAELAEEYKEAHKFHPPPPFAQTRRGKGMNDILADMEEIVMGALEKDPVKRPQNIQVFALTLKEAHDKAVEREKTHKTIIDMATVRAQREKQKKDAQQPTQPPQVQEQRKDVIEPTVPVFQDKAQGAEQFPGHQQEAPQQPAANLPDQIENAPQHAQLPQAGQIFLPAVNRPDKTDKTFWVGTTDPDPAVQEQRRFANQPTVPVFQDNGQSAHHLPGHQQEAPQQPAANLPSQAEAVKLPIPPNVAQEPRQEELNRRKEEARNWLERAYECKKAEKYEEALAAYDQAIKLDLTDTRSHYEKGVVLNRLGRYQEALHAFDRVFELYSADMNAYEQRRGHDLSRLGMDQEAFEAIIRIVKHASAYKDTYRQRGYAFSQLGMDQEALQDLDRAIELDPKDTYAYKRKGLVFIHLNQYQEALKAIDQAIELDPKDASPYEQRGLIFGYLGRYQEALAAYEQALAIDPTLRDIRELVATIKLELLKKLGKSKERR